MTRREMLIVVSFLTLPIFLIGLLTIVGLIIGLMPREQTRQLRRRLAGFTMWQWSQGSRISAIIHQWLWARGNGH